MRACTDFDVLDPPAVAATRAPAFSVSGLAEAQAIKRRADAASLHHAG